MTGGKDGAFVGVGGGANDGMSVGAAEYGGIGALVIGECEALCFDGTDGESVAFGVGIADALMVMMEQWLYLNIPMMCVVSADDGAKHDANDGAMHVAKYGGGDMKST